MEKFYSRYDLSDEDKKRLEEWRCDIPNDGDTKTFQPERYEQIYSTTKDLAKMLLLYCPRGRQLSIALARLEETRFWANNAIATEK